MKPARAFAIALLLVLFPLTPAVKAHGGDPDSLLYKLSGPPSQFEWGCFDGCACPIQVQSPLTGTFVLIESHRDPLYTYYDVRDVEWQVPRPDGADRIRGSGTYRHGGEVALMEQLTLDLSFDGAAAQHFDSGLKPAGAPFPRIATRISLHGEYCLDSVLVVDAQTHGIVGVPGVPSARLTAGPNPFRLAARISFAMPGDGVVDLAVFDLAGRRVRTLAHREWLTAGDHAWAWDGRFDGGANAPAGLYFVLAETATERATLALVKLR